MRCVYKNDLAELDRLTNDIQAFGEKNKLHPSMVHCFNLCLDEVLTNIVSYGFDDASQANYEIILEMKVEDGVVHATVSDEGKAFNPLEESVAPDLDAPLEKREIGGLGIFFLKEMMDDLDYKRLEGRNHLSMSKRI